MTTLWRNSLLFLLIGILSSCTYYHKSSFSKLENCDEELLSETLEQPVTRLFKSKIYFYDKYYTGLLVVKSLNETEKQVVLVTEIGVKLLDMTITEKGYTTNFVIPPLDKKIVLNHLWKDFSEVFYDVDFDSQNMVVKKCWEREDDILLKVKKGRKKYYFLFDGKKRRKEVYLLEMFGNIGKTILFDYKDKHLESVEIDASHLKLKVKLEKKEIL
ncbi:hypothetical protein [Flammeovirga sp. SJP92]|uniref:hypothetical protein n=1 Tax=Flammeovirga sp. SJP92 TaxID=1775430 RepID=UPI0007895305|nr:hypothetical protein [Flammeovirga sp. SJP92]KXX71687.1 hypothetical protein AVL50_05285 [Flammeovirga sp. SJP92]